MMSYKLVDIQRRFKGINRLDCRSETVHSSVVKMRGENSFTTSANFYQTIRHYITKTVVLIDAVVWNSGPPPCNCMFNIRPETLECLNEDQPLWAAGYILQKTQELLECQFVRLCMESQLTALSLQIIRLGVSDCNLHSVPYNNVNTVFPKTICPIPNITPFFFPSRCSASV